MNKVYEAYDGTIFNSLVECFNYEWNNQYSDIEIYDPTGIQVSDFGEVVTLQGFFIHVHTIEEQDFINKFFYLDGDWEEEHTDKTTNGYYMVCFGIYDFYTRDNLKNYLEREGLDIGPDLKNDLEA